MFNFENGSSLFYKTSPQGFSSTLANRDKFACAQGLLQTNHAKPGNAVARKICRIPSKSPGAISNLQCPQDPADSLNSFLHSCDFPYIEGSSFQASTTNAESNQGKCLKVGDNVMANPSISLYI